MADLIMYPGYTSVEKLAYSKYPEWVFREGYNQCKDFVADYPVNKNIRGGQWR